MQRKTKGVIVGILIAGVGSIAGADAVVDPYTEVGTQLEVVTESTIPEAGIEKISVETTQPKVSISKWNDEINLGVMYTGLPSDTTGARPSFSKNVEWSDGDQTMQLVPVDPTQFMEDGGVEINIILNSPPASNVFTFQLENWENLDFWYQLPLWQERGLKESTSDCNDTDCNINGEISHRPDNIVGSYAVYYKGHKDHREGQINYATGKAFHILRPLVTDKTGVSVLADLSYVNGILTVTVPQSFLDTATYPVTVDPTFGKTAIGGTSNNVTVDSIEASHYTLSDSGAVVTMLTAYTSNGIATHNMKGVIYSDSAAQPLTLKANSAGVSITTTAAWRDFTLSVTLAAAEYWLGLDSDDADNNLFYDAGAVNSAYFFTAAGTYTTPPTTWTDFGSSRTRLQSNYATYTTGSAPVPVLQVQVAGQVKGPVKI